MTFRRPTLEQQTDARLRAAGYTENHPAIIQLRNWNAVVAERGQISVETRRGQFGQTRRTTLGEAERAHESVSPHPATERQARASQRH